MFLFQSVQLRNNGDGERDKGHRDLLPRQADQDRDRRDPSPGLSGSCAVPPRVLSRSRFSRGV
jgi:hypothetical protein